MVLFGENLQVSEIVKGMDKGLELLGFDSGEKSVGGLSKEKVSVVSEKSVGVVSEEKTPTTKAIAPWLTLQKRMTPHKHLHGESGWVWRVPVTSSERVPCAQQPSEEESARVYRSCDEELSRRILVPVFSTRLRLSLLRV